jgi:hypothetical protein
MFSGKSTGIPKDFPAIFFNFLFGQIVFYNVFHKITIKIKIKQIIKSQKIFHVHSKKL